MNQNSSNTEETSTNEPQVILGEDNNQENMLQ